MTTPDPAVPVFQISGSTYRLVSCFHDSRSYPGLAPAAAAVRPMMADLGFPTVHWVDGRHYLADGRWRDAALERAAERLDRLAQTRRGDTCVVVGNGPSLKQVDLDLLDGYDVFLSNYAATDPVLRSKARYLSVVNPFVAEQDPRLFDELAGLVRFFPYWLRYCLKEDEDVLFLNEIGGEPFFSTNVSQKVSGHSTVTHFNLQIAYSLGYRKVVLIGIDNTYHQPVEAKEGDVLTCEGDDPNHFRPDYFRGKKWQAADPSRMELVYRLCRDAYDADGREIVNCTAGGALEVYRRGGLALELPRNPPPPASSRPTDRPGIAADLDWASWMRNRHRGQSCSIVVDAPLPGEWWWTSTDAALSVDQRDLGFECPSVRPHYLLMTDAAVIRQSAPDIRLLRCVKFLACADAPRSLAGDPQAHGIDSSTLPDPLGLGRCFPESADARLLLALRLAAHLGFASLRVPVRFEPLFTGCASLREALAGGGISLAFR
jgi:hypothetical protein